MFVFVSVILFICMVLILLRLFSGPTLYDRVLAVNVFGTCTGLFIGASVSRSDGPIFSTSRCSTR